MTADEDMAEKYDQDDGAQKILEHFQEKHAPGLIGDGFRFSVRKCDNARNVTAVSVSSQRETVPVDKKWRAPPAGAVRPGDRDARPES
jgi:hypothetical protein